MKKSLLALAVLAMSSHAFASSSSNVSGSIEPFTKPLGQKPEAKDQKAQATKTVYGDGITKLRSDKQVAKDGVQRLKLAKKQDQTRGEHAS